MPRMFPRYVEAQTFKVLSTPDPKAESEVGRTLERRMVKDMLEHGYFETGTILAARGKQLRVRGQALESQYLETYTNKG